MSKRQQPAREAASGAFPGGTVVPDPGELRIAIDKAPYAAILGHSLEAPDIEVCGVLVGRVGTDDNGTFVHISAVIRGEAAREEGAAVTFTHETWNHIHKEMDRSYPDETIVGWYHTHGGHGVFLSDMDTFIHRNFFSEAHHLAYVYDPLAGSEAFFHPQKDQLVPARRYWMGGRERRPAMRMPEPAAPVHREVASAAGAASAAALERAAVALQQAAAARGSSSSLLSLVPWLIAAVAIGLLVSGRGIPGLSQRQDVAAPLFIVESDPLSGRVMGIPIETGTLVNADVVQDDQGRLRAGVVLRTPSGDRLVQPGLLTMLMGPRPTPEQLERERKEAEDAAASQAKLLRYLQWGAGGLALFGGLGLAAWYMLNRRR